MFCGLLSSLFAERLVRIFVPNDTSVVQEAGAYLRIISLSFGFLGVQNACIGVLRGAGLMSQTMLISVLALWIVQFPLCYVLAEHTPLATHGIYWGVFGANLCACLLAYGLYKGGEWKRTRLIETAPT
jgi:Na+-driven multidrug efflux pump